MLNHKTQGEIMKVILQEIKEAFPFLVYKRIPKRAVVLAPDHTWTTPRIGRQWPEPPSLVPYYIAVAVVVGLLILYGVLCEVGFVDYGPVL